MKKQNGISPSRAPFSDFGRAGRRGFVAGAAALCAQSVIAPRAVSAARPEKLDLSALEARHGGRIGFCAESEGSRAQWRAGERFAYLSTFKLFLAASTLGRVGRGLERLDRPVPILESDMVPHAPVTGPAIGATLTVEELCQATVDISENPAANILIREMGGLGPWQDWYRSIGDEVTRVDRYEVDLNSAIPGDPRDTTTPEQAIANLDHVLRGGLLSAEHLSLLERWIVETPTGAGRIKAGVPPGYRVGHKTGTGARSTHNDIGIVWPPSGPSVLIAVYFTGAADALAEETDAVIAEATRIGLRAIGHG